MRSLPLVRVNLLNVSTNGAGSMITDSGWLAFLDSELCIVRCGDEFGLEFNCKGALKPVLGFCGGIGAAGGISVVFFSLQAGVSPESSV